MSSISACAPGFRPPAPYRSLRFIAVAGAHVLLAWALLSAGAMPAALEQQVGPLMVALVSSPEPAPAPVAPALPRPDVPKRPAPPPLAPPQIDAIVLPPAAAAAEAAPQPAAAPASAVAAPALPALPEPVPAAPPRRRLDASAVRYRVLPPAEVPLLSRRAGESGVVWLRVVVDATGAPAEVVLHRSSGFARLDEQARWAMRQARFSPHSIDGRAVEVEVIAPVEYPAFQGP